MIDEAISKYFFWKIEKKKFSKIIIFDGIIENFLCKVVIGIGLKYDLAEIVLKLVDINWTQNHPL